MSFFSSLGHEFGKMFSWIKSDKAQKALDEAAAFSLKVAPIVKEIADLVPNKTIDEIAAAYSNFAIPMLQDAANNQGLALLNLATQIAKKSFPGISTTLIQTAIQLALTAIK